MVTTMLQAMFATKKSMTQAWTASAKRLAVTRLVVEPNLVVRQLSDHKFQIGYGSKKLKNVPKPARVQLERAGFSLGVRQFKGVEAEAGSELKVGQTVKVGQLFQVGDVIEVQGTTKGRGFAGGMKRHGFHGGPKTHGQSDRSRAVGSIGAGTSPGRVWRGKRMPGHMGMDTKTIKGLVVLYVDSIKDELWVSGPVPGSINSIVKLIKTGLTKQVELDKKASGIQESVVSPEAEVVLDKK